MDTTGMPTSANSGCDHSYQNTDFCNLRSTSQFAHLYRLWVKLEAAPTGDENQDRMTDLQGVIMQLMENIPCESLEDIFYKLAIWRRDCLGLNIENEDRGVRLGYSALRDVAALSGLTGLLNDQASTGDTVTGVSGGISDAASPSPAPAPAAAAAGGAAAARAGRR